MSLTVSSLHPPSHRARIYLYAIAAIVVVGFLATAAAIFVVNRMKNQLVEESMALVRESGEKLAQSLTRLLESTGARGFSSLDAAASREVLHRVEEFTGEHSALTLFTLIEDGRVAYLISPTGGPSPEPAPASAEWAAPPRPVAGQDLSAEQEAGETVEITLSPKRPDGSGPKLQIVYLLSPKRVETALQPTARAITRVSWLLVGLLLALLAAAIVSLARVLAHLMAVHDEANRLDRLAYVGTLAAGLAHEIRNPLNAMNINLDLVAEDLGTDTTADPATRRLLSSVKSEIAHLNKTVENFLAYARPPRQTTEVVDLAQAAREAVMAVAPELESRGIACHVGPLPDGAAVRVDPTALHRALTNILLNAAEAMDKPQRCITVTGQCDGHVADLSISDNGQGIPPDNLDHIFDVFFTTKPSGTGLGLPTAKRVIEDAKGTITVDSIAGQGTQVTITLPLAKSRRGRLIG